MKMRWNRPLQGVAITEYALPAVLLLIVAIAGFQALGGGLDRLMGLLKTDMNKSVTKAGTVNAQRAQTLAALQKATVSGAVSGSNGPIPSKICDASGGNCMSINSSLDMKSTIQTVGANGAITVMSDKLRLLTAQLVATGQITAAQAGIFNDLANQGYKIGQISGLIEEAATACGSNAACFDNKTVTYNGQPVKVTDLSNMIGYAPTGNGQTTNNPEVDRFWNIYKSLPNSVWNDPALKGQITTLTTQIAQTSNLVMWGTSNIQHGYMSPSGMQDYIVTQAQGSIPGSGVAEGQSAQGSINGGSTTICVDGRGRTTGTNCY